MPYTNLLNEFTAMSQDVLGSRLTGVYLHGSAVMDGFNPVTSDLDLIVVIDGEIIDAEKRDFIRETVRMNASAPEKGIEMSVVQLSACRKFMHPAPYELHFSPSHLDLWNRDPEEYLRKLHGTDPDLAAHFTVIRRYGRVLTGAPIDDVFGDVPREDYIASILFDVENAYADILVHPTYMTLNLCRVLAFLRDGEVLSKKSGGEWGLKFLPVRFRPLLEAALDDYTNNTAYDVPQSLACDFAGHMMMQIDRETNECRFPAPADSILEDMSGFFEKRVEGYDEHMIANVEGCREGYPLMASLVPDGAESLLDLGCGTGLELDEIFRLHPDLSVTAVDLCPAMLEKLRGKHPDKDMNLICGDYFTADFGSGYDCAVSFETMHHFTPEKKAGLYRKIADALTPDGCYIECDYMVDTQAQEDHWFAENRRIRALQNIPEDAFFHFDTPCTMENQRQLLLDAGFTTVELVFRKGGTAMMIAKKEG
ncbi:MAG: DUF4111 domain-containing protein [Clostridia bacterium]|nr:DUF4111 domain-containing protein [Clostridia bacterium]